MRALGRATSFVIARAPVIWPLMRAPTRRFWERSASSWDDRIDPDRPEHLAPLAVACDHLNAQPDAVLELGTGTGSGALMLARRFPNAEVHAVDISEAMVEAARAKAAAMLPRRIHFAVADAASLPYGDDSFDLVAQLNLPTYFDEMIRVLRPGGHVIIGSSLGSSTPYYTPDRVLRRAFRRRGVETAGTGQAGTGTYFVARRPVSGQAAA
jgi:SAM-dependent methyltransferase